MSGVDPEITLHQDGPFCYRAQMEYTNDTLDAMAQRAAERIEDELVQQILARLGYVKVVRCKECKQADIDQTEHEYHEPLRCCLFHMDVKPENFCCWACKEDNK